MESKNQKLVESFNAYCKQNPSQRFWQALRNWAQVKFVFVHQDTVPLDFEDLMELQERHGLQDTFNWEGKQE